MAQGKLGDMVIVTGKASGDAEFKLVGAKNSPLCTFSLIAGKRKDTTTIFVNCKAWYGLAHYCENIKKGDSVCVIGTLEEREYNGKTYTDLVVEWVNIVDATTVETSPSGTPYHPATQFEDTSTSKFSELDGGDGDLPF
jgi:single-stranded DNA-binding protein